MEQENSATKRNIHKSFRFNKNTQERLIELREHINKINVSHKIPLMSEADLIEQAITNYHIHTFGVEGHDYATEKMEAIINSSLSMILGKSLEPFAQVINSLTEDTEKIKTSLFMLLLANEILPHNQELVNELVRGNVAYNELITNAINSSKYENSEDVE